MKIDHAAILAGGFGKRLGAITKKTPKPLIKVNNLEFIKYLIFELIRNDFKKIIILTNYKGSLFKKQFKNFKFSNVEVICLKEKKTLGTGGSVSQLKKFNKDFLVLNGDSYTKVNFKKFLTFKKINLAKILLVKNIYYKSNKQLANLSLSNNDNVKFSKRKKYMNGGVYLFKREYLKTLKTENISLEYDLIPKLIHNGLIEGHVSKNISIDIGLKKNLNRASSFLKKYFRLKAILFDRDGTLNKNYGYVYKIENFKWLKGVIETIKLLSFFKIKSLVITNQSGIGRGYYSVSDFKKLNNKINKNLKKYNIKIDKFYYAPYYKFSKNQKFRKNSRLRKPDNGMILKAMKDYKLSRENCFMIGDSTSDLRSAKKTGINFYKKQEGSLFTQIINNLRDFNLKY